MAKIFESLRWKKDDQKIFYKFLVTHHLGSNRNQAWIEREFRGACDQWASETGLTFTQARDRPFDDRFDLTISWQSLGPDNQGRPRGGTTDPATFDTPIRMVFNQDTNWEDISRSGCQLFQEIALHELGHAIGMGHSSDQNAIMHDALTSHGLVKRGLDNDDKVGARYLYRRPPLEYRALGGVLPHGTFYTARPILLVNEAVYDATYIINDGVSRSIKGGELTYYEDERASNRVQIHCNGETYLLNGVPRSAEVDIWHDKMAGNIVRVTFYKIDRYKLYWGLAHMAPG